MCKQASTLYHPSQDNISPRTGGCTRVKVPHGNPAHAHFLAVSRSWVGNPPQKITKHGLGPFLEHRGVPQPMYNMYFNRVPSLYIQNDHFLKLPGDLQKVCKNTGVLTHRVPDAYVFIGKTAGVPPPMYPSGDWKHV